MRCAHALPIPQGCLTTCVIHPGDIRDWRVLLYDIISPCLQFILPSRPHSICWKLCDNLTCYCDSFIFVSYVYFIFEFIEKENNCVVRFVTSAHCMPWARDSGVWIRVNHVDSTVLIVSEGTFFNFKSWLIFLKQWWAVSLYLSNFKVVVKPLVL